MFPDAIPPTIVLHVDSQREEKPAAQHRFPAQGANYTVKGVTLLPVSVLKEAISASTSPEDAAARVSAAYRERGYFLVAPQVGGEAPEYEMLVVEGKISEIAVPKGIEKFFLPVAGKADVTAADLEKAAALAQSYAARQGWAPQVTGFSPAADPGTTRMTVSGQPLPGDNFSKADFAAGVGNQGNRYAGRVIGSLAANYRPGGGVELNATYSHGFPNLNETSRGSSYNSVSLGGSVVAASGVYSLNISNSKYRLGETYAPSYPEGQFTAITAGAAQLVRATDTMRLTLSETLTAVKNKTEYKVPTSVVLPDERFTFAGVSVNGTKRIGEIGRATNLSFGLKLSYEIQQSGTSSAGTTAPMPSIAVPHKRFLVTNAQFAVQKELPAGFELAAQVAGQYANTSLPQYLQWVGGGSGNLSAWLPGTIVADRGGVARVSAMTPKKQLGRLELRASLFSEYGYASVANPAPGFGTHVKASDYGIGLSATTSFGTALSLEAAKPIKTDGMPDDYLYRQRSHFYFNLLQKF